VLEISVPRPPLDGSPPFTPRAKKVLELSLREALQLGHNYIGTEHILLGLVREGDGVAAQVFVQSGCRPGGVRQQVIRLVSDTRRNMRRQPGPGSAGVRSWSVRSADDGPRIRSADLGTGRGLRL